MVDLCLRLSFSTQTLTETYDFYIIGSALFASSKFADENDWLGKELLAG